jgi:hypothetical protein
LLEVDTHVKQYLGLKKKKKGRDHSEKHKNHDYVPYF